MYDLGDYPGVVLSPTGGVVEAELYRIDRHLILQTLDDFELYRPGEPGPYDPCAGRGSLFVRRPIVANGVRAYLYVWNGRTAGVRQIAAK